MAALSIFVSCLVIVVLALILDYVRHRTKERQRDETSILQDKLRLALKDPVTHLLGWEIFKDRIAQVINESERYQFTMGVAFVDIDDFKLVNEALGPPVGDKLLLEVAGRLATCLRQVDSISRYAKDTFVLMLAQLAKPETAAIVAQRILQSLSQPFQIDDHEIYITVCIGIALYPSDGKDTQSLLQNADQAMHLAKGIGKHTCQFYQEKMHLQSQRELSIYNSLSRESIFNELFVYFQPIVDVRDRSVWCMQALLEWRHVEVGLIPSQELYEYAERQRKLNAISEWTLRLACQQFQSWRKAGFEVGFLGVSLSTKQLENSNMVYQLSHVLQELNFNPQWLLVEVRGAYKDESAQALEKAFNMLNYLGVNIAMDDPNSGVLSLHYLKNMPMGFLKLDSSLIADVVENQRTQMLIKAVLLFAQSMSMRVVISGIENEQQKLLCQELGCELMQGSLIGLPRLGSDILDNIVI